MPSQHGNQPDSVVGTAVTVAVGGTVAGGPLSSEGVGRAAPGAHWTAEIVSKVLFYFMLLK